MFDYIIIGAGSAGCVLAHRLSEDPETSVLLIEAGGKDSKTEIHIPAAFSKLFKTEVDWGLESIPQEHSDGRRFYLPRGKVMGGCSSINAMIYIRGNKKDYDHWADLGNKGWSYEELLPLFRKSENFDGEANKYHGKEGPLNVTHLREPFPLTHAFIEAGQELGFEANEDFNGEKQEGFGIYQVNQQNGKRMSGARAFIKPIRKRKNLTVLTNSPVQKILLEGKKAVGIVYKTPTHLQEVKAKKEVILAAGAYHSPQLLMVSGIGPEEELHKHGITPKHVLEGVGKNLQDHLIVPYILRTNAPHTLDRADKDPRNLIKFLIWGDGPLSSNVAEGGGFIHTAEGLDGPDIQFHFGPAFFIDNGFTELKTGKAFSIGPTLLQPESIGTVSLSSGSMEDSPVIDHAYLESPKDMKALVEGLKLAQRLAMTKALGKYRTGHLYPEKPINSDQEWEAHIRKHAQTLYHPAGTCKMGNDELSVVNSDLKVHGIEGLRVVDASIMPKVIRGNTHAPVLVIAEKAAELILSKKVELASQVQS